MGYTKTIYRELRQSHDDSGAHKMVRVVDKKAAGTAGGASSATTWNVREMTDILVDNGVGATIAGNKVTLPIGTYCVDVTAPAHGAVGVHRVAVVNTTPDTDVKLVIGGTLNGAANVVQSAQVRGVFELTEESEIEIRHYTANAVTVNGLGLPADVDGDDEFYTIAEFRMENDPRATTAV